MMDLKESVLSKFNESVSKGGMGYKGRLCVSNVDELKRQMLVEAHSYRYSINLGATKI